MAQGLDHHATGNTLLRYGPTTPVPNFLFDEIMPTLADTPWRLLCVVVRQTLGWQTGEGRRKERDWLSHAQLKARTGRGSAAICAGLEQLVRQQLVEAQDERRRALTTPQERRRAGGRVYYRLHPRLWQTGVAADSFAMQTDTAVSEMEATSDSTISQNEKGFSDEGFHKAKTTKEKQTKVIFKNKESLLFSEGENAGPQSEKVLYSNLKMSEKPSIAEMEVFDSHLPGILPCSEDVSRQSEDEMHCSKEQEEAAQAFVEIYRASYQECLGHQTVPPINSMDMALLKRRLAQHTDGTLEKWLPVFFHSTFGYVRRRHYSLESFLNALHVLQASQSHGQSARSQ